MLEAQFTESARLEKSIRANLKITTRPFLVF